MRLWRFVRPSVPKVIATLILLGVSMLWVTSRTEIGKLGWDRQQGLPLTAIMAGEYHGPCEPDGKACDKYFVRRVVPAGLLADALLVYSFACAAFAIQTWIKRYGHSGSRSPQST